MAAPSRFAQPAHLATLTRLLVLEDVERSCAIAARATRVVDDGFIVVESEDDDFGSSRAIISRTWRRIKHVLCSFTSASPVYHYELDEAHVVHLIKHPVSTHRMDDIYH